MCCVTVITHKSTTIIFTVLLAMLRREQFRLPAYVSCRHIFVYGLIYSVQYFTLFTVSSGQYSRVSVTVGTSIFRALTMRT
jgi:hypothetical protein